MTFAEKVHEWRQKGETFRTLKIAETRLSTCRACEHHRDWIGGIWCSKCGCPMHLKTQVMEFKCPLNPPKWDAF
jgi:hypothetical protein